MKHEERNNLYAYLGQKNFKPVVSKKIKLVENDMIALYTRGIWENVDEAELDDVFAEADNEVKTTVDNIEDLLLSRQRRIWITIRWQLFLSIKYIKIRRNGNGSKK